MVAEWTDTLFGMEADPGSIMDVKRLAPVLPRAGVANGFAADGPGAQASDTAWSKVNRGLRGKVPSSAAWPMLTTMIVR